MNLFTRYLNSAAVFIPPNDKAAAEERKNIDVVVAHSEDDNNGNQNQNENDKGKEKDKDADNDDNEDDEGEDEDDEEIEDKDKDKEKEKEDNETPEQKAAREKEERKQARVQKRINKITAERDTLRTEMDKLKKQLEANPKEGLTEEEVERRATEKAKQIAAEEAFKNEQKEFAKRCDKLQAEAAKIDPKIEDKITDMVEDLGPVPVTLVNILADLDNENGGSVLNYLADNVDEAEDIYALSERKMTQSLIRISDKLKAEEDAKKGKERQRRNTNKEPADPIRPVNESGRNHNTQLTGNESMDDFVRIRNAQDEARRKARNGGLS